MPNPIKYSTGTETLALKKGNFYIGTGAVGKGPTSETGYYNGITPPSGGYTIYLNKESGGPSIYTVSNDAQLISLTNSIAGQSYTGTQQCFDYYYSQNDKVLVNQDYPADYPYIVMDGLVLYLDAGITQSYPGSGTTWTDVNGLGPKNNGALTNGPTFNSGNGGSIVFDGVDDYVNVNDTVYSLIGGTLNIWFKRSGNTNGIIGSYGGSGNQRTPTFYQSGSNIIGWEFGSLTARNTGISFTDNTWFNMSMTFNSSFNTNVYINSVLTNTETSLNPGGFWNEFTVGKYGNYLSFYANGNFSIVQVYNRALTATEVLQNYNATKGRFGL
jgi:hypothetical protein